MKYLIPLILLFPSLVFAESDNSNNSRIQALELEDTLIKEKILLNKTLKADEAKVVERLLKKAEKIKVDAMELEVLKKIDKTEVETKLSEKADKTEVNGLSARVGALEEEDIVLHGRVDTVESDLAAIESLPVGATPGDILYWDGSVWQLSPAPPVSATTPVTLTLISGVPTWTEAEAEVVYAIGDTGPAGGIVFYITEGGLHGLEAAPVDQTNAEWGCSGTALVGADRTALGAGAPNTADIVSDCADASTAGKVADIYVLNGYDDWFLPSIDELNLLYSQKDVVGGFASEFYWSSSEVSISSAWAKRMGGSGTQTNAFKGDTLRVRAVRAF